jgi:hypothetical protein
MRISNNTKGTILFWLAVGLLVLAVLLMSSCSTQRKLNKAAVKVANNKEATAAFFDEYSLNHDITQGEVIYVPGQTIVKDSIIRDTIYLVGKGQTIREKHYVNSLRVDTVFQDKPQTLAIIQICKSRNETLNSVIDSLNFNITDLTKVKKEWKKEAYIHRGIWIAIFLGFFAWLFIKFLRPLLKLYFKI